MGAAANLDGAAAMEGATVEDWALAVCVGLGPDGTTVALCLSRSRQLRCESDQKRPGEEADDRPAEQQRDRPDPTA